MLTQNTNRPRVAATLGLTECSSPHVGLRLAAMAFTAAIAVATTLADARPASGAPPKGPSYTILKLDDDHGAYPDAFANDINNRGQLVGKCGKATRCGLRTGY